MSDDRLAIYVHWPFCRSKCPYCDFNSHVREAVDHSRWRAALLAELDYFAAAAERRTIGSVFFGGGTPSLMEPETVAALIDRIAARWRVAHDVEITLEANPNSAEQSRFAAFRAAGVNRLSLGVQALDDASLAALGRGHSAAEALAAVALAARTFDRYSFDLIYARPRQSRAAWEVELRRAIAIAGDHLSLYQLTVEPGTAFAARHARGELVLPAEHDAAELYEATQAMLEDAGLAAYEISNHARPGGECRHNLAYWRYEDYVGVGPGAHGRLTLDGFKTATRQERAPETWLASVERTGHASAERRALAPGESGQEALMMGLRLSEGIDPASFARRTATSLDSAISAHALARLVEGGFIVRRTDGGLAATPAGRRVLNAVLAELMA